MASLVDTNVLVYCFDPRHPEKQARAEALLRRGAEDGTLILAYQTVVEFVSVVTQARKGNHALLERSVAVAVAAGLLEEFEVLYPTETTLRAALEGAGVHGLPWYDACLWAYAKANGIPEILSEDFQQGRSYGRVRVVDPFA